MQEELNSFNPYNQEREVGTNGLTFTFTTDLGIIYQVYFVQSKDDFPAHPHLNSQTYTFGFGPSIESHETTAKRSRIDPRVKDTIIDILRKILQGDKDIALMYICSSKGDRQSAARSKLFSIWLRQKDPNTLFDLQITSHNLKVGEAYMSVLVRNDSNYYNDFKEAIDIFRDQIKGK